MASYRTCNRWEIAALSWADLSQSLGFCPQRLGFLLQLGALGRRVLQAPRGRVRRGCRRHFTPTGHGGIRVVRDSHDDEEFKFAWAVSWNDAHANRTMPSSAARARSVAKECGVKTQEGHHNRCHSSPPSARSDPRGTLWAGRTCHPSHSTGLCLRHVHLDRLRHIIDNEKR